MSRKRRPQASSLDLLLDTICNTFGGVLFVAMLVAVLARTSSIAQTQAKGESMSVVEIAELESKHRRTTDQITDLEAAVERHRQLADDLGGDENAHLIEELSSTEAQRRALQKEIKRISELVALQSQTQRRMDEDIQDLEQQAVDAETKLREAEAEIASETESRSRTGTLPQERRSSKDEIGWIVRYDRLYAWLKYDDDGNRLGLNTDDFVVLDDSGPYVETTPKPYAGTPLTGKGSREALIRKMARFNARRFHMTFAVWPDSFDSFHHLKNTTVELGFEYRLIPIAEDEVVTDRGASDGRVQ